MPYTFDMDDNKSIERINRIRKQIFLEKEESASLLEKLIIATAIIKFEAHPNKNVAGSLTGRIASNHCKIMELYILEDLYRETIKRKNKKDIEETIRKAFIEELPHAIQSKDTIEKLTICMMDASVFYTPYEMIMPEEGWVAELDLTTEPSELIKDRKAEEAKKEDNKLEETEQKKNTNPSEPKIFIIHGHDKEALRNLKDLLDEMNVPRTVLQDTDAKGKTIIEALEAGINEDTSLAIVLMTPDDFGGAESDPKKEAKPRARQNVIFEMGMAIGAMKREKVFIVKKDDFEAPSDISGILYVEYKNNMAEISMKLMKRLRSVGVKV